MDKSTTKLANSKKRGKRLVLFFILPVSMLLVSGAAYSLWRTLDPVFIPINPKTSYLRVGRSDRATDAIAMKIADLGVAEGDWVRLQRVGFFFGGKVETRILHGVFSKSPDLLPPGEFHRIPGAIDAGMDAGTGPTFYGKQPNNIPEDFRIDDVTLQVPKGAAYLFVAPGDSLFRDNEKRGDFGVRITRLPVSFWPKFIPLPEARVLRQRD